MLEMIKEVCGFSVPEFTSGRIDYVSEIGNCVALSAYDVSDTDFKNYGSMLESCGFSLCRKNKLSNNIFLTYQKGENTVFLSFYPMLSHITAVYENGAYIPSETSDETIKIRKTTITQVPISSYGLSYVIGLSDGRYIIIDGGFMYDCDADLLMDCLRRHSDAEKPVIAAWIMTHPHIDHYRCFMAFDKKYHNDVVYESFIYSFPVISDKELETNPAYTIMNEHEFLPLYEQMVADTGAKCIRPHTGQVYQFADAKFEFLNAPEDVYKTPLKNVNAISLAMKMTCEGQIILWTGDCDFETSSMTARWGEYLKADILQTPHHGYILGGTIEAYKLIDPAVCLHPDNYDSFAKVCALYDTNRCLYKHMNVKELYVGGDGEVTLTLPHTPAPNGQIGVMERFDRAYNSNGRCSFIFPNVSRDRAEFVMTSTINLPTELTINMYFDHFKNRIERVKMPLPELARYQFDIVEYVSRTHDIPDDEYFSVQMMSNYPIEIVQF